MATAKKAATAKPVRAKTTEEFLLRAVKELRSNPEKYAEVRKTLKGAKDDKSRVKGLLKFATSEKDLASLMPIRGTTMAAATVTTVTVTTIFILEDSAY